MSPVPDTELRTNVIAGTLATVTASGVRDMGLMNHSGMARSTGSGGLRRVGEYPVQVSTTAPMAGLLGDY